MKHRNWLLLVCACVAFALLFSHFMTAPTTFVGADNVFIMNTGLLELKGDGVQLEAASSGFFMLKQDPDRVISAKAAPKPLGWTGVAYYVVDMQSISGGVWEMAIGYNVTIHISAADVNTRTTLSKTPTDLLSSNVMAVVIALLLFGLGAIIGHIPSTPKR
jgi:hypothetical protein